MQNSCAKWPSAFQKKYAENWKISFWPLALNFSGSNLAGLDLLGVDIVKVDALLVQKNPKHHFFRDIENSFHEVTQIGLEPH